jgi:hypothetical protein
MSGWDILIKLMKSVPPIAALLFFLSLGVIFAIGFSRHGLNFIKYGFKQTILDDSFEKRFGTEEGIAMASEVLMTISRDEAEWFRRMGEEKYQLDRQSELVTARREERLEIFNLLKSGKSIEEIERIRGDAN